MNRILAIGELLWDVFPTGPRFGGAAANFACACARLGRGETQVALASAVGPDDLGTAAVAHLREAGVQDAFVAEVDRATGRVLVSVDDGGQPSYTFVDAPAWDVIPWSQELAEYGATADVVYFGTLAQRGEVSRQTIQRVLRDNRRADHLRILDLNLRPPFWTDEVIRDSLSWASAVKLNDEELPRVAAVVGLSGPEEAVLSGLLDHFPLDLVALTRGARGSLLLTRTGERSERGGTPLDVVDTVGAGDAFTAALSLGLARRLPLNRLHHWATRVAEHVCTQPGGTPDFPSDLTLSEVLKHS